MKQADVVIAGAGFAGLAAAKALASRGMDVVVLERKKAPGVGMHTTGILVKEATDWLKHPNPITRTINNIQLYSPSLQSIDLKANDYYFLTTDTPALMQHFSEAAKKKGAEILYGTAYKAAYRDGEKIVLPDAGLTCRYLIGADGPRSKVAEDFRLGINRKFLLGVEAEFSETPLPNQNTFYCFLNNALAYGYMGWVIPGVGITQVGLATRSPHRPDLDRFLEKVAPLFSLDKEKIVGRRGGLIPVGGLVRPISRGNVFLLGDAGGMVSPFSAGGIHTALHYGDLLGKAIANHQGSTQAKPSFAFQVKLPRFALKKFLRWGYERFAPNWLLDILIGNSLFRALAKTIFFNPKRLKS